MSDDLKKLLDLASFKPVKQVEKTKESPPDILRFIHELSIEAGDTRIPNSKIYFVYKKWRPKTRTKKYKKVAFFTYLKRSFKSYANRDERGYYLTPKPFILNEEDQKEYDKLQQKKKLINRRKYEETFRKRQEKKAAAEKLEPK